MFELVTGWSPVTKPRHAYRTRSILVTGTRGGQGTTTVAAALALHAAESGDAVLTVPPEQGAAAVLGHPTIERERGGGAGLIGSSRSAASASPASMKRSPRAASASRIHPLVESLASSDFRSRPQTS